MDTDGEAPVDNLAGCKYAFGCALLILFILAAGGPLAWLLITQDLRGYGL